MNVYGLKNCDTCRKALRWLNEHGAEHSFHDIREADLSEAEIANWAERAGWEKLLNRRGTTWRKLPDADKDGLNEASAAKLMALHPALMKRPVIVSGEGVTVGFDDAVRAALLKAGDGGL